MNECKQIFSPAKAYNMRKKKRLFNRLRGELIANELTNPDLGRIINRGECYVSRCLNGKAQFTLAEQYAIMDAINRPYRDLYLIFPPSGRDINIPKDTAAVK